MQSVARKQYMMLGDRPVLAHTLDAFQECRVVEAIYLVIPEGDDSFCKREIIEPLRLTKPIRLVSGGATRQESVYNGLNAMDEQFGLVVIHDGVRPFVTPDHIAECIRVAREHGGCILGIPASDTMKTVDDDGRVVTTLKRDVIRMAQTPQAFVYKLIIRAHLAAQKESYVGSDDAELMEKCGEVVRVIPGDPHNIKITTPEDLKLAEALLLRR